MTDIKIDIDDNNYHIQSGISSLIENKFDDFNTTKNFKYIDIEINILSMEEITNEKNFIDCNFNLKYTILDFNEFNIDESIFMIENCIEEYSCYLICKEFNNDSITYVWNYKCKINIHNNTKYIPYNHCFFYIKLKLKYSYCSEYINNYIILDKSDNYIKDLQYREINNHTIINKITEVPCDNYYIILSKNAEITYIWQYDLFNIEHIWKYFIFPTFLTITQQLVHSVKNEGKSDWVSIVSGFILSDIALLFTIPETNTLIFSEKILYLNILLKLILGTFAYYDWDVYFGEIVFPNLGHHNIDIILVCVTIFIILFLTFYELYIIFSYYNYINIILEKKRKDSLVNRSAQAILWTKTFIKNNNKIFINHDKYVLIKNNYNFKIFLRKLFYYCKCKLCKKFKILNFICSCDSN